MVRGPLALVTAPKPQAKGPGQLTGSLPAALKGCSSPAADPPGAWKICRLNALKNEARKSTTTLSAIFVFLPIVKSSFLPAKLRAPGNDLPSFGKVKSAGSAKAAAL